MEEIDKEDNCVLTDSELDVVSGGQQLIRNAEGKIVEISNILGQVNTSTIISRDNAIVPTGIVIVSVEGEEAAKIIVKG